MDSGPSMIVSTVGKIGPNSALIFDVELVEIQQPAATAKEEAEPAAGG